VAVKKLRWKKSLVEICTPLHCHHDVKGYSHGELAVHKIPCSKPIAYTITHIKTGMRVNGRNQAPYRTLKEAKEFVARMLQYDTWYIEGAEWGDLSKVKPERIMALSLVVQGLLQEDGYKIDKAVYNPTDKETVLHKCDCGKIAQRYILAIGSKWKHKCLSCEPHTEIK